jgi:6-phosphogluconate dehydrogenase
MPVRQHDIGLIGLAVMGQNLTLNMERNGFAVAVYNRTGATSAAFVQGPAKGKNITATYSIGEFVAALKRPSLVMIMVKAGEPVDAVIEQLLPGLEPGDLIIDCGNSFFLDTERRYQELEAKAIQYLGIGISGGEKGALWGPSIMPGGQQNAYAKVEPILKAIAADVDGEPCVTHVGPRGSGHFVKMVHNGIEYGDMQLIAEAYDILHRGLGLSAPELHSVFARWNEGKLGSYLVEITADIFTVIDEETGQPLVDLILDEAEQKGTGRWAAQTALDLGVPTPTLNAAVEARIISAYRAERELAASVLKGSGDRYKGDAPSFINAVADALYAAKICSYAQGFALLRAGSQEYEYNLNYGEIARIWRGGCIIRARFLDRVRAAFAEDLDLANLLLGPFFRDAVGSCQGALRLVLTTAADLGIPTPAMSTSLAYFDSYRSMRLPANLLQAQRDYFGAHTYQRVDREGIFTTKWTR